MPSRISRPGRNVVSGNCAGRTSIPISRTKSASRSVRGLANMSRRLRERRLGLGKGPVDPLRQQRDVGGFHGGAAPDPQARRGIAVIRKVVAGAFLLDLRYQLFRELRLRIRGERGDRGIDDL